MLEHHIDPRIDARNVIWVNEAAPQIGTREIFPRRAAEQAADAIADEGGLVVAVDRAAIDHRRRGVQEAREMRVRRSLNVGDVFLGCAFPAVALPRRAPARSGASWPRHAHRRVRCAASAGSRRRPSPRVPWRRTYSTPLQEAAFGKRRSWLRSLATSGRCASGPRGLGAGDERRPKDGPGRAKAAGITACGRPPRPLHPQRPNTGTP